MNPNSLSESDLDRLEQLLEADVFLDDAMRLDEVQAILCAIVSGPVPVEPAVWLPEVLGKGMDNADDARAVGEAVGCRPGVHTLTDRIFPRPQNLRHVIAHKRHRL